MSDEAQTEVVVDTKPEVADSSVTTVSTTEESGTVSAQISQVSEIPTLTEVSEEIESKALSLAKEVVSDLEDLLEHTQNVILGNKTMVELLSTVNSILDKHRATVESLK